MCLARKRGTSDEITKRNHIRHPAPDSCGAFVLPCIFLVFPTFDIHRDDLWQMDSLMEFICAYKNTAILAIAGVLIQIVIALPAGYAIARIPSPKVQTFFLLTCVFFLLLPQQALMLPQYLVLMIIGWLDSLKGLLIMTAFQPWMILLFWFAAKELIAACSMQQFVMVQATGYFLEKFMFQLYGHMLRSQHSFQSLKAGIFWNSL